MIDFSNMEEVSSKLQELKDKNLPHMTIEQFSNLDRYFARDIETATEEEKKVISEQLYPFFRDEGNNNCIFTDRAPLLEWGITHGVAVDCNSGLSWACYHYFTINGKERRYETMLQYHPDNYEIEQGE